MPTQPRISVLIVTHNSEALLAETLEALFSQEYPEWEALLLDNASTDQSLSIAKSFAKRGLRIIESEQNLGFAGGNNAVARHAKGSILLLLNPDAILPEGALLAVAAAFDEHPRAGVFGTKLLTLDGTTILHFGGEIGPLAHCSLHHRGETDSGQCDRPREVEYVVGAMMAIKRQFWDFLDGFDEGFHPAYYEDADLCLRCHKAARQVLCLPIPVRHNENVTLSYESPTFLAIHHRNRLRLIAKHWPLWRLVVVALPLEMRWFLSHHSLKARALIPQLYLQTFQFFLRERLLRRRPPASH